MHILVVDDDGSVRTFLRKVLEAHGHSVVVAASGAEGVERLCDAPPVVDAVVLDLVMPAMDGWATFRAMRALKPFVPVVLVSGFDAIGVAPLVRERAVTFVPKPFTIDEIVTAIRMVAGHVSEAGPAGS